MKVLYVTLTFAVFWQFKDSPHYKVTKCKKVINCKTGKLLKYGSRGYFIDKNYVKKNEINKLVEKIK